MKKKSVKAGVDLGTKNTLVYIEGQGIVFNEPSVVAFDMRNGKVIALGSDAAKMVGKTHGHIRISKPIHQGVISDLKAAYALLEYVFGEIDREDVDLSASTLLITCPSEVTQIEREAMVNLAHDLGIRDVFIEEEVKAGTIGAGIDIYKAVGSFVIDIGGGSTDIGVMSLGDIVVSESIRIAGNYFDAAIKKHVQFKHKLLIGDITAEKVKIHMGTVRDEENLAPDVSMKIAGRDLLSGLPREIEITQKEIRKVLLPAFEELYNVAKRVFQQTPPELTSDIIMHGIYINGGGSLIDGADQFFEGKLEIKAFLTKNPLTSICEGTKVLLRNRDTYRRKD